MPLDEKILGFSNRWYRAAMHGATRHQLPGNLEIRLVGVADDRKYVLPPRSELPTSMESLIHHFKLVTEGYRVPPGEIYYAIESPRGELGCFVLADGSSKPARVHFRDPSFVNLQAFRDMAIDSYIADMICSLGMLDPILGGVDR